MEKYFRISPALKFDEYCISRLRKEIGEDKVYSPEQIQSLKGRYIPDAIISKDAKLGSVIGVDEFDNTKDTVVDISYILSPVKLNRIISFFRLLSSEFNFLLIYKEQRLSELELSKITLFRRLGLYIIKNTDIFEIDNSPNQEDEETTEQKINYEDVLKKALQNRIQTKNYSLFLGAGVSIDAGLPGWSDFMKKIIGNLETNDQSFKDNKFTELDYDDIKRQCFDSSLIIGQYLNTYCSNNDNLKDIAQKKLYQDYDKTQEKKLIDSIVNIIISNTPPKYIISYNYDDLIESSIENKGEQGINVPTCEAITCVNSDTTVQIPIYHVHGFIPQSDNKLPTDIVLTEETYHELYQKPFHWSNIVQLNALNNTTCIFIGFSMSDPNLRRLLDISMRNRKNTDNDDSSSTPHYVYLRRDVLKPACPACAKNTKNEEIQEKIMNRLGLNVIWFDKFEDLPKKLNELIQNNSVIENNHKKQNCLRPLVLNKYIQ